MRNETAMTARRRSALGSLGHQPGDPTPEGAGDEKRCAFVPKPEESDGYFGSAMARASTYGITTLLLAGCSEWALMAQDG
jgi:hypothetical protein